MNRHGAKLRIRHSKGGIEGPVFHVVAHVGDERWVVTRNLAEVVVSSAERQPKHAQVVVDQLEPEVEEVMRRSDVELKAFECGLWPIASDTEVRLISGGVDRASSHPLAIGLADRGFLASMNCDVWHQRSVVEH